MNLSRREVNLALITISCLLFGGTWYVANKRVEEWKSDKLEIQQIEQDIRRHQNAIAMQSDWSQELDALQTDLRVFEDNGNSVAPDLLKVIKQISSKNDFLITQTRPQNEKIVDDLFELAINCSWEGSLEATVKFLAELQKQGVNYDVRTLNITPGRTTKDKGKLRGNMVIHCAYTRQ